MEHYWWGKIINGVGFRNDILIQNWEGADQASTFTTDTFVSGYATA